MAAVVVAACFGAPNSEAETVAWLFLASPARAGRPWQPEQLLAVTNLQ